MSSDKPTVNTRVVGEEQVLLRVVDTTPHNISSLQRLGRLDQILVAEYLAVELVAN